MKTAFLNTWISLKGTYEMQQIIKDWGYAKTFNFFNRNYNPSSPSIYIRHGYAQH